MVGENFNSINPETRMWVNNAGSKGTCVPRFHFREDFRERKPTDRQTLLNSQLTSNDASR